MARFKGASRLRRQSEFPGLIVPQIPEPAPDPAALGNVLSQLFQLRGYGRKRQSQQLSEIWQAVADPHIANQSRAVSVRGGVLHVTVRNTVLLAELNGFYRAELLSKLHQQFPSLGIQNIKFRLQSRR